MMEPFFAPPLHQPLPTARKKTQPRKPASQTASRQDFQFISSGPVGKPDPNTRRFIRSHVMRGKNTKRQPLDTQHRGVARKAELVPKHCRGYVRAEPEAESSGEKKQCLVQSTQGTHFEYLPGLIRVPCDLKLFNFASPLNDESRFLIFRFLTTVRESMHPVEWCLATDPTKACWFRWLLEDTCYLESIFFLISAFQDFISKRDESREPGRFPSSHCFSPRTRAYLKKTIHNLQECLQDRARQVADTTTTVVISLAMVADLAGDTEAFEAHIAGLKQMVKLRGGLKGFSHNRQLQVKLCRVDLGWSIKHNSKPEIYGGKLTWDPFLETALRTDSITFTRSSNPEIQSLADSWDYKLKNVFHDARDFANVANRLITGPQKLSPDLFQEIMLSIHFRLLLLEYPWETQPLEESIRLGLLAFESVAFLQIPSVKMRSEIFTRQLRNAIQNITVNDSTVADIKLWLLLVGSISIFGGSESWLVECINELSGNRAWPEVRMRMKEVMWIDAIHDVPGRRAFEQARQGRVL